MAEGSNSTSPKRNTFGTTMSFDLELAPAPKRRVGRRSVGRKNSNKNSKNPDDSAIIECPGCGSDISDEEWLEALVGFVSGAHDFEIGNPVRARIVQTLKNEVSRMAVPHPIDDWELATVARLMKEIERIVQAEVNRYNNGNNEPEKISSAEKQQIIEQCEERVRGEMVLEVREQVIMEISPIIEAQLRQEIENKLWAQFEAEWRNRVVAES